MKNTGKSNGVERHGKKKLQLDVENQECSEDDNASNNSVNNGDVSEGSMEYESDGDNSPNEGENNDQSKVTANPGWADAMQKILNTKKPKRKKTIAFSKAKKLSEVQKKEKKENVPFEVDGEKEEPSQEDTHKVEKLGVDEIKLKQRRKDSNLKIRVKPSIHDREREKMLQKIATKGVVQLFNAVRQQQAEIDKKLSQAGPLERKRERVLKNIDKRAFLDVLMGGSKSIPVNGTKESEKNGPEKKDDKVWSVLRDDFVMGGQMKNWDKKGEEDEDSSAPEEMDSDE